MIELRRLMEEGHARVYALAVSRDLFGARPYRLEIAHGRMGWKSRRRTEYFGAFGELAKRAKELLRRRERHGYRIVMGDPARELGASA
jgi:predicted DNA-binding WGR domain protein